MTVLLLIPSYCWPMDDFKRQIYRKLNEFVPSLLNKKSEVMSCHILRMAFLGIWLLILDLTWKAWLSCLIALLFESIWIVSHMSMLVKCYGENTESGCRNPGSSSPFHYLTFHVALHDHLPSWNLNLIICDMRMIKLYLPYQVGVSSK